MKKTPKTLTVHVVLDRSGSMNSIKDDTIGAFNGYVEALAKDAPKSSLSLTSFSSQGINTIVKEAAIGEVKPLDGDSYIPGGLTPLYDAIGKCADLLADAKGKHKALVILTDGQENDSREYKLDAIKKLLAERQEKDNWLVIYLGANQDAFAVGASIGVAANNAMNYTASGAGINATFAAASRATRDYGKKGLRSAAAFTSGERAKAMSGDKA